VHDINIKNKEFVNLTKEKAHGMSDYMMKDRFSAAEFERNLERNLK
jgi:hypothetical protein